MDQAINEHGSNIRPSTTGRHQDLRAALIKQAEGVVSREGLAALRVRNLAVAVGCSVGAVYNVFADLDAVILEVNARTLAAIDRAMAAVAASSDPSAHLVALARAYLDYAASARRLWSALFQHEMTEGRSAPDWYAQKREAAFSHVEAPLARLRPDLSTAERVLLARSLFAAVHGMVALGLDEKVASMPLDMLRDQVAAVVSAIVRGFRQ